MPMLSPTIFREYDIRGLVDQDLTEEAVCARRAGRSAPGSASAGGGKAAVGRDCAALRPERFAKAMIDGAHRDGRRRRRHRGRPDAAHLLRGAHRRRSDGICMITGSHNPPEYNGFKIGLGTATLHGEEIQALRRLARVGPLRARGRARSTPYDVVDAVPRLRPKEPAAREAQAQGRRRRRQRHRRRRRGAALRALGIELVPLFCEMDGRFPNHHPDPTVEKNLEHLKAR